VPPEHGPFIDGVVRQSTLRSYDQCPRRAVAEAQREFSDYSHPPAALGTAFHMVAEEMLRTMRATGNARIPSEEAIVIMREVIARPDCPHLSVDLLRELRIVVVQFSRLEWPAPRVIALEERLWAEVPCPDGIVRRITGKPDVLIADPPGGAVCLDYKVSWAVPATPRDGDYTRDQGRRYLSDRGIFQLDTNGLLIMRSYPAIGRVSLREYYPRLNEFREAWLDRDELEHVERHLGLLAMRFEQSMAGLLVPEPRPGRWCSHCPVSRACPVPQEDRGVGVIDTEELANAEAARWDVIKTLGEQQRKALKAWHEETGHWPEVGDGRVVGWHQEEGKTRKFEARAPAANGNGNGAA
jgi:hypothetical protein